MEADVYIQTTNKITVFLTWNNFWYWEWALSVFRVCGNIFRSLTTNSYPPLQPDERPDAASTCRARSISGYCFTWHPCLLNAIHNFGKKHTRVKAGKEGDARKLTFIYMSGNLFTWPDLVMILNWCRYRTSWLWMPLSCSVILLCIKFNF